MSWDHPVHSFNFPNGEPQTPTRTPTATVFGDSAFQTPKLESSFFDPRVTWDTSDPYASSPEFLRTPQRFGLNTPSNPLRLPDTAEAPIPRSAKASDHQTDTARRIRPSKPNGSFGEGPRTVDSAKSAASMQTPPPSSASRRKIAEFEKSGRRPSTPGGHLETPSRLLGASPRLFADLQSSPDPFQLASLGPSGSPFFPQQKLFWDHDLDQQGGDLGSSGSNASLYGANTTDPFNNNHNAMQDHHIPQLPAIEGGLELPEFNGNSYGLSAAPTDAALFPAPFSTSPRLPITKAEDPAMFLSSPARRIGGPQPTPHKRLFSKPLRQPYHHQTEEHKRDELRRVHSVRCNLPAYDDDEEEEDDYTPRRARPGLTRSVTHNALTAPPRPMSAQYSSGMMASTSGIRKSPSKGKSSPIKPVRPQLSRANSVTGSLPTRSRSLVLKIGKDGRAKTEMETVSESSTGLTDPVTGMDLDGSATESEYDSAEFSEYPAIASHNPSFALSDAGRSMLAHSDSGSRPHSKGSYTSTAASSHSGRVSPWAGLSRTLSRRAQYRPAVDHWNRTTPQRQTMVMNSDLTHGSVGSVSGPLAESDEDTGGAQHALRKVLKERGRIPARPHTVGHGFRPSQSFRNLAHLSSSPPRFGAEHHFNSRNMNTSPTTMTDPDLATPTTDRYSNPSRGTRCVCNSMDNGGHLMIQCESCSHWLHTKCVGLERSNLPSVYVCVFCAQTPTRKNRNRGLAGVGLAPTSPLAHKSYRFR